VFQPYNISAEDDGIRLLLTIFIVVGAELSCKTDIVFPGTFALALNIPKRNRIPIKNRLKFFYLA